MSVNAEKPRRGVFEVRVGQKVISSTGPEPRPFPALKALDVAEVAASAVDEVEKYLASEQAIDD